MRINNNIMAMNTHRQYSINTASVSKSTEKLSSGYRINRAGDDAAGLAISEKMRAQIRGLTMASKNSSDAISLVQTAEGALQETHNILQRMRELAVQSASDTNETSIDRAALQAEFEQLQKEIDDISTTTRFNDQNLLDGTFQEKLSTLNNTTTTMTGANAVSVARAKAGEYTMSVTSTAAQPSRTIVEGQACTVDQDSTDALATWAAGTNGLFTGVTFTGQETSKHNGNTYTLSVTGSDTNNMTFQLMDTNGKPVSTKHNVDISQWVGGENGESYNVSFEGVGTFTFAVGVDQGVANVTDLDTISGTDITFTNAGVTEESASATRAYLTLTINGESVNLYKGDTYANFANNGIAFEFNALSDADIANAAIFGQNVVDGAVDPADQTLAELLADDKFAAAFANALAAAKGDDAAFVTAIEATDEYEDVYDAEIAKAAASDPTIAGLADDIVQAQEAYDTAVETWLQTSANVDSVREEALDNLTSDDWKALAAAITTTGGAVLSGVQALTGLTGLTGDDLADALEVNAGSDPTHAELYTEIKTTASIMSVLDGTVAYTDAIDTVAGGGSLSTEFDAIGAAETAHKNAVDNYATDPTNADAVAAAKATALKDKDAIQVAAATFGAANETDADVIAAREAGIAAMGTDAAEVTIAVNENQGSALTIQTGANQGDELTINVDRISTETLGIKYSNISTREAASQAITEVNNAINKVSTQRAALGALQNRLDHKIANLDTSAENLTAAESRIRDLDMAKEMTNFTKNNILVQASTAMLAQANAAPQGVLQLLG